MLFKQFHDFNPHNTEGDVGVPFQEEPAHIYSDSVVPRLFELVDHSEEGPGVALESHPVFASSKE